MLCSEPSIVEVPQERLGGHVLGEMSAVLFAVLILMILTRSCCTNCWVKRCLSSMCFAFFEDPILVTLPAQRVRVNPDVHLLDVERFL